MDFLTSTFPKAPRALCWLLDPFSHSQKLRTKAGLQLTLLRDLTRDSSERAAEATELLVRLPGPPPDSS